MFSSEQYELVDFGSGRKLERFSGVLVDRESPIANGKKKSPAKWNGAIRFSKPASGQAEGAWSGADKIPQPWLVDYGTFRLSLKLTPFGHLGVFPEQSSNWSWIDQLPFDLSGLKAINLFGYTGGTTLALAARGATVSHVDSAKNVVGWARSNAGYSNLDETPVRWLVEDAVRFVTREIKRENHYDIVVADPPSFGRGTKNETWKLQRDFSELVAGLAQLTRDRCRAIIVSCHTPEFDKHRLHEMLNTNFKFNDGTAEAMDLALESQDSRSLKSGCCFRWFAKV